MRFISAAYLVIAALNLTVGLPQSEDQLCQDALGYMSFLRENILPEINQMLDDTLTHLNKETGVENPLQTFFRPVVKMHQLLTSRITSIRKQKLQLCNEVVVLQETNLVQTRKDISNILDVIIGLKSRAAKQIGVLSQNLLRLKLKLNDEIMRLVMIPEKEEKQNTEEECEPCQNLEQILTELEPLEPCHKDIRNEYVHDEKCLTAVEIDGKLDNISVKLDENINTILRKVMLKNNKNMTKQYLDSLSLYKGLRTQIDDLSGYIQNNEGKRLNKYHVLRLKQEQIHNLKRLIKLCPQRCTKPNKENCGLGVLQTIIDQLSLQKQRIESNIYGQKENDYLREDLIGYLNIIDDEKINLEIKKISSHKVDECVEEKIHYLRIGRDHIWHLVNLTIQDKPDTIIINTAIKIENDQDCWNETKEMCGNLVSNIFNSSQTLSFRRPFMPLFKMQKSTHHSTAVELSEKCPQNTVFDQSAKECSDRVSNCWSPGQGDTDCHNNGLCCFDGCANRCQDGPNNNIFVFSPKSNCKNVIVRKCSDKRRLGEAIDNKIYLVGKLLETLTDKGETSPQVIENESCDSAELEQTKTYIQIIDETFKESKKYPDNNKLFKLGLVDIQGLFDKRVSSLFMDELCCHEEVDTIKQSYMTALSECMDQLMTASENESFPFCFQTLRKIISLRNNFLLEKEIKEGLNQTRTCSCYCKKAARRGQCPAECQEFSSNPSCCVREATTPTATTSTSTSTTTTATSLTTSTETISLDMTITTPTSSDLETTTFLDPQFGGPDINPNNQGDDTITMFPDTGNTIWNNPPTPPGTLHPQETTKPDDPATARPASSQCPAQCQLPQGLPWAVCPAECGMWSGGGVQWVVVAGTVVGVECCTPPCPAKCTRAAVGECRRSGVRECSFVPGCCPDKYEALYGNVFFEGDIKI